jgi:general secretion pathway protein D
VVYKNVGVEVQVVPKVEPANTIIMRIVPEVSTPFTSTTAIGNGLFATGFNVQTVESTVICEDGETIAIGGIITTTDDKTEAKVPWLGDLPWIGAAFRYRIQTKERVELVFLLTPHVMRNRNQRNFEAREDYKKVSVPIPQAIKAYSERNLASVLPPAGENMPGGGCGLAPTYPAFQPQVMPGGAGGTTLEPMPAPRTMDPSGMPSGGQKPHLVMPEWPEYHPVQQPPPPGTLSSQAPVQGQAGPPLAHQ